jgi:phospholipase/carboxylesterase
VRVARGAHEGVLLTPGVVDPSRRYPLFVVFHGAGRGEERLAAAWAAEPERRQALFLFPRSRDATWDLIVQAADAAPDGRGVASEPTSERPDLDFLEYALDLVYGHYPIDPGRQALVGYSDGASYALSVGLSNPGLVRAVLGWAAGFLVLDAAAVAEGGPRPAVLLEHGTHDDVFPFAQVALPMRERLERLGYAVEFRVDEGGRHWPSGDFLPEALDWFFSEPWQPRT